MAIHHEKQKPASSWFEKVHPGHYHLRPWVIISLALLATIVILAGLCGLRLFGGNGGGKLLARPVGAPSNLGQMDGSLHISGYVDV